MDAASRFLKSIIREPYVVRFSTNPYIRFMN